MKTQLFYLVIFFSILPGALLADIIFTSQAQLDAEGPGLVGLYSGNITITSGDPDDPIVNLLRLSALTSVGGDLWIEDNFSLTNLDGLSGVTSVGGDLWIDFNTFLTNLDGLSGVTSVEGDLRIEDNFSLTNLDGLRGVTSVEGDLRIWVNNELTNLDGLSGITSVGGDLSIGLNFSLTNLDGLSGVTSVGGDLGIGNNDALTNLDGLSGITSVGGDLSIGFNTFLTNLDGLSGVTSVGGDLSIGFNTFLTNLDGLSGVTSVGGDLGIRVNDELTNLDGLSGITSVGGDLGIRVNDELTNLDGLSGITSVGGDLWIIGNRILAACAIQVICEANVVGTYTIENNAPGCNSLEEVVEDCTPSYEDIRDLILSMMVPHGLSNALLDKLANAEAACNAGNPKEAVNILNAFIRQVDKAQRDKKISSEQADLLVSSTEELIGAIHSGEIACVGASARSGFANPPSIKSNHVYPNPTNGLVHFQREIQEITIRNALGQVLHRAKVISKIDLAEYESGIYLIEIGNGDKKEIHRVIKQ